MTDKPDAMTDLEELRELALAAASDDACGVCHGEFRAATRPPTILSLLDALAAATARAEQAERELAHANMLLGRVQAWSSTSLDDLRDDIDRALAGEKHD